MQKNWLSLGLMSGTSGDGVDASIINTNGIDKYEIVEDRYFDRETERKVLPLLQDFLPLRQCGRASLAHRQMHHCHRSQGARSHEHVHQTR